MSAPCPAIWRLCLCMVAFFGFATAAHAIEDISFDLRTTLGAVEAQRGVFESDDVDSSGIGADVDAGVSIKEQGTRIELRVDAGVFDYSDEERETRKSLGVTVAVDQEISDTLAVGIQARRVSNVVTLESRSADQRSLRGEATWQSGNDRLRLRGDWRWRDYDDTAQSEGAGPLAEIQYNRRLGPYHWARATVRHDAIESKDAPRRNYNRQLARVEYSHPIAKRLRLRPALEYRQWSYDSRPAMNDSGAFGEELRRDTVVNPELGLAYGKTSGLFAEARAEYEFRDSNDMRYREDAPRFTLEIGYRF